MGVVLILLIGLVFGLYSTDAIMEPGQAARLGRNLFIASSLFLVLAAAVLPAWLTIEGVQREREGGALDLLALTGISAGRVLWSLIASRSLRAFLILAGVSPLLALLPTLGGVGIRQVLTTFGALLLVFITSTAVGGFMAVASRSLPVAVLATAGWWITIPVLASVRLAVVIDTIHRHADRHFYPIQGIIEDPSQQLAQPLATVVSAAPWLTAAFVALLVAGWLFRRGIARGWQARDKSWPGLPFGWLIHVPIQVGGWFWLESNFEQGDDASAWLVADEGWLAYAIAITLLCSASVLYLRTMAWLLPRLNLSRERFRIPVFGDPLLWRETMTNSQGGLSRAIAIMTFAWALVGALLMLYGERQLMLPWAALGGGGGAFLSVILVTASIMEERAGRTLALLLSTTRGRWRIAAAKLLATVVRILPLVLLSTALMVWAEPTVMGVVGFSTSPSTLDLDTPILTAIPYVRGPANFIWCCAVWASLLSLATWLAVRLRARTLAWTLPSSLAFGALVGLPMVAAILHNMRFWWPGAEGFSILILPALARTYQPGVPLALVVTTLVWFALAALFFGLTVRALRRVGGVRT